MIFYQDINSMVVFTVFNYSKHRLRGDVLLCVLLVAG